MGDFCGLLQLTVLLLTVIFSVAAAVKNRCDKSIQVATKSDCFSCAAFPVFPCPHGFLRKKHGMGNRDCKYEFVPGIRLPGCSHECVKDTLQPECCPGFWGNDCIECPESAANPCSNNGVCSDGIGGNGTCSCKPGFVGTACEECGSNLYGPTCSSVCKCVHGLCSSGLKGDGSCTCFSGYKGLQCDMELPECTALSCGPEARCVEQADTGKLVCRCKPGYLGNGVQCTSINPCLQRVCHPQATCTHVGPNQHVCKCVPGYSGDGIVCMSVDPCQTQQGGCSSESTRCVYDGPGQSHCECLPGFVKLNELSCKIINKCKPDSCHKNAVCTMSDPTSIQCLCKEGYIGNGQVCYGNLLDRIRELNSQPGGQWTGQLTSALSLFESVVTWPLTSQGPFTIFVPTNKGFSKGATTLKDLLADPAQALYLSKLHMLAGEKTIEGLVGNSYTLTGRQAEILTEDNQLKYRIYGSKRKKGVILDSGLVASNGIIHIISKLMDSVPPTVKSQRQENLMKILADNNKFSQFRGLLQKTSMKGVLDGEGPFTVFAPTNAALTSMEPDYLNFLSSDEGATKLLELLRHHVINTKVEVFSLVSQSSLVTMANQALTVNTTEEGLMLLNEARVLEADVEAKNGRLYSVDGVLIPPSIEPLLPHRCDVTSWKIVEGHCTRCERAQCYEGIQVDIVTGCDRTFYLGCFPKCNVTETVASCCKGFYGPDCMPCPGGYTKPCSGHGTCNDGMGGNGTCMCEPNFTGSRCQYCSNPNKYGPECTSSCLCLEGECDNRRESDGRCKLGSCNQGYGGRFCERQTRSCGPVAYCHTHASCDFSGGTVKCVCNRGFRGDGITCVETDPCGLPNRGGCGPNTKCVKTGPATHVCQCLAGWKADGDECQPVDNCQEPTRGNCHSDASCIYIGPGQSDCTCKSGYHGNGFECEPINPCVKLNGGCHYLATCVYQKSKWKCVCEEGYSGDGKQCYGTLAEVLTAEPLMGDFYRWVQDAGLSQFLSETADITVFVPNAEAVQKMSKEDRDFWLSSDNLPSLVRSHIVQGLYPLKDLRMSGVELTGLIKRPLPITWTNETTTVGGAILISPDMPATNGLIYMIDKVLAPDHKLSVGLLEVLSQRPELSLFRESMIKYNLTDQIGASSTITVFAPTDSAIKAFLSTSNASSLDVNVTKYHIVVGEKLTEADLLDGLYKDTMLGFSYQLGTFRKNNKLLVNTATVNTTDIRCSKGVVHTLNSVLSIPQNRCDKKKSELVTGKCMDCLAARIFGCPEGSKPLAFLSLERRRCLYKNPLVGNFHTIGCKMTCINTTIVRKCCAGYFGPQCETCPGPEGVPCGGQGVCSDGTNGTGVCRCNTGFNGTACEMCLPGKFGIHCDQDCKCEHGRCKEGPDGDGSCECDVDWTGTVCSKALSRDSCGGKCHTSANCLLKVIDSTHYCSCAPGFQGNGTYCTAVNVCENNNGGCSPNALCKRTSPGRRVCLCNSGYLGDGLVCKEINPCLEGTGGCDVNAECMHTGPNRTSCICRDGFSGNGKICTAINPCKKKNGGCDSHAKCEMTGPGQRNCSCPSGFIGNGFSCQGNLHLEIVEKNSLFLSTLIFGKIHDLSGKGPFTVFVPTRNALMKESRYKAWRKDMPVLAKVVRYHIVPCSRLLPEELKSQKILTTMMGDSLHISIDSNGTILINNQTAAIGGSEATNGILYTIDTMLVPPTLDQKQVNHTALSELRDYSTFAKLVEDTAITDTLKDTLHQPFVMFMPSDRSMSALPQERRDFLYAEHNRAQLLEYLRYHIVPDVQVPLTTLQSTPLTTLHGSDLQLGCAGQDKVGQLYVNDPSCLITPQKFDFPWGKVYGIDCLLSPPSLGGRCDILQPIDITMPCGGCSVSRSCPGKAKLKETLKCDILAVVSLRSSGCQSVCTLAHWKRQCCHGYYGRDCMACPGGAETPCENHGKCDEGSLGNGTCTCDKGFTGDACELCEEGHFGPDCKACNCTVNGTCNQGRHGDGSCFCKEGWMGKQCEAKLGSIPICDPPCAPKGVCKPNNTCVCKPFYEGDGITCTVADLCKYWNGGCAAGAKCRQSGEKISCTCPQHHKGDGFVCTPIDPCAASDNGGCHEHADCKMTAPGKKKCECKSNYIGDGVLCELKELPLDRCAQDNGQCHFDAQCTDLHYEDKTVGVFHYRSPKGTYKLNYTEAQLACSQDGATLATYIQLSYAQQAGMNMCAAGWLSGVRVGYPTTYSNPKCGFGHVGIVDYGVRNNLSETWDAFCYRLKDVQCACKEGYIGDGYSCTGNLLQVLNSQPRFSNFLAQILNYSQNSVAGKEFVKRLSNLTVQSTLFVTDNSGLNENETLSSRDLEYHLSDAGAVSLQEMTNGSHIRTRLGQPITVIGVPDLNDPSKLTSSRYLSDRFLIESDIMASNGIIHVLRKPLTAPPPKPSFHVGHQAGMGIGVILLLLLIAAVMFVGYHFYTHKTKPFQFHYFREDEGEDSVPESSICNPMYDSVSDPTAGLGTLSGLAEEDKHQVVSAGSYNLQES
ncbi:stabilin-2 [Alosa sapidissima]|uniref:stabilin-2 n=1 Tax=Alosa sapidissima TaxID=34773 RepID=UPI001C08F942|nr:stabilin-2 [Alosa sapidissima]